MKKKVLGVLASGRGTNLKAISDAINAGKLKAKIGVIVSDNPSAGAISYGAKNEIPTACINYSQYDNKEKFEQAVLDVLNEYQVELVVLAGFMRILSSQFLNNFPNRIMNIHPSLLPSFPGLNPQQQALDSGVKISGCTVHFVNEGIDTGPIIMQKAVPVSENETVTSLSNRILHVEHITYHTAIGLYCAGRLKVENGKVRILSRTASS